MKKKVKAVIGWREWADLPSLKIKNIKGKIDSGARSSSLHAFDLKFYKKGNSEFVKFKVHPDQRSTAKTVECRSKVLERRTVKSSNGKSELRPVIVTDLEMMDQKWPIELTLTNRDEMGFRLLLGREAFRKRFLVDAGRSYYCKKMKPTKGGNR